MLQGAVDALQHLLQERNIQGAVSFIRTGKLGQAPTVYSFRVDNNAAVVESMEVTGGPLDQSLFASSARRFLEQPYSRVIAREVAARELTAIYRNHGYLRASFAEPGTEILPATSGQTTPRVKLTFTVVPGPRYSWNHAEWRGNNVFSAAQLSAFLGLQSGEIAAADRIEHGEEGVLEAYGSTGYIQARCAPEPQYDDAARTVTYAFNVQEGAQYRMGRLLITGLFESAPFADQIRAAWQLKPGNIYNATYLRKFLREDWGRIFIGARIIPKKAGATPLPDPTSLRVDVRFHAE